MSGVAKPTFAKVAAKAIVDAPKIVNRMSTPSDPAWKTPTDASSDSSVKQSVASGTTFALDEASIRPDDSASLRAVEDEENSVLGSRAGSDTDARAFSAQLNKIKQIVPRPRPNIQFGSIPLNPPTEPTTPAAIEEPNPVALAPDMPEVDEKLLEGLSSPRDRVFILKIEQDILDFMKNEREQHLTLPDCNSFYRMLSHRLAEYYGLDHTHHPRETGTAVLISKTPQSRVPPPLAALPTIGPQCESPPPPMAARRIMRRGDDGKGASGPSTTANSEGPSKATSEIDGASETGRSRDRAGISREEREARYNEVRLRIFGKDPEVDETKKPNEEMDMSRSSSTNGRKKQTKKRNTDDDDFQPRSQFPGYVDPHFPNNGCSNGSFYFPQGNSMVAPGQPYSTSQTSSPPPMMYPQTFPQMDISGHAQFLQPQPYGRPGQVASNGHEYSQTSLGQYDLNAHFSSVSFNSMAPSHPGQKAGTTPNFGTASQPHVGPAWQTSFESTSHPYGPQTHQPPYGDRMSTLPHQNPGMPTYPNAQLGHPGLQNGKGQPHPLPGSYNRHQSFNPQTQAFIPGGRAGPMPIPQNGPGYFNPFAATSNGTAQYRPASGPIAVSQHRGTPPQHVYSAYSSPGTHPYRPNQSPVGQLPLMSMMTPPAVHAGLTNTIKRPTPSQSISPDHNRHAHPLPQPPHPESSIAKWGTPAHLPPKPPTPSDPHPSKFIDLNKGLPARIPALSPFPQSGTGAS